MNSEIKQGARVQSTVGEKGVVLSIKGDKSKVGFDNPNLGYGEIETDILMSIPPSPAISTLPEVQRNILLALHEKRVIEGQWMAYNGLFGYGYVTDDNKFTPYGRYMTQQWVEAGMPVDEVKTETVSEAQESTPAESVIDAEYTHTLNVLPSHEETIVLHKAKALELPLPRPGDNLFFEQEVAKELEDLRVEVGKLRQELDATQKYAKTNYDAWQSALSREQALQDQLVEEQKVVIRQREELFEAKEDAQSQRELVKGINDEMTSETDALRKIINQQRQELETLKDAKVNATMSSKPSARAYVTKTLMQNIDPERAEGALLSPLNMADDEIQAHVDAGWRVVHEEGSAVFNPIEGRIVRTRTIRFEQRPTSPTRPRRAEAKAEAAAGEQIIFEAEGIVEKAFTFEEALKSGKYSAEEMIEIGNAEVMATMKRTYEGQAPRRPFVPLPLIGKSSTPISQIVMEIKRDE